MFMLIVVEKQIFFHAKFLGRNRKGAFFCLIKKKKKNKQKSKFKKKIVIIIGALNTMMSKFAFFLVVLFL